MIDFRAPLNEIDTVLNEWLPFLEYSLKSSEPHGVHPSFNKEKTSRKSEVFYIYLHSYQFFHHSWRLSLVIHRRIPVLLADLSDFPVNSLEDQDLRLFGGTGFFN